MKKNTLNNVNIVAFFNILGPVVLNGISFFTIPIFTAILGTANYGMYTIYNTWVNTFSILVSLQVFGSIGVASVRMTGKEKTEYYSSILSLIVISFILCSTVCLLGMPFVVKYLGLPKEMIIVMLCHSLGMAFVNFATVKYTYEKKSHHTFLISVAVAISGVVLSLLLLKSGLFTHDLYFARAYGTAIPYIVLGTVIAIVFYIQGKKMYSFQNWKFCLTLCLPMVFHALSQLILAQVDKVMLKGMMSDEVVGIYSFTYSFAHIMNIIYCAFNNTWVPFYYEDTKENRIQEIKTRSKNYIFVFTALSSGFVLLAPDVIKLFAGEEFWEGISLIPIFVLANYMIFLYSFPVNYEFYHKKSIHIAIGTSSAAIINCVLNYFLIPYCGMAGAAYATLIAYCLLWIFHHLVSKNIIKKDYHYKIKDFIPGLSALIIIVILVGLLEKYIIVRWTLAAVVGIFLIRHFIKTKAIF